MLMYVWHDVMLSILSQALSVQHQAPRLPYWVCLVSLDKPYLVQFYSCVVSLVTETGCHIGGSRPIKLQFPPHILHYYPLTRSFPKSLWRVSSGFDEPFVWFLMWWFGDARVWMLSNLTKLNRLGKRLNKLLIVHTHYVTHNQHCNVSHKQTSNYLKTQ